MKAVISNPVSQAWVRHAASHARHPALIHRSCNHLWLPHSHLWFPDIQLWLPHVRLWFPDISWWLSYIR